MQGKIMLDACSPEVKDIIIRHFNTLDDFYAYVYKLSADMYVTFKRTKQFDTTAIDRLKAFLEHAGIDFMQASNIVDEIGADFDEIVANNYAQQLLGPEWKSKLAAFEEMTSR